MTQLLYDPVDLSNYAKRGDPPIEEWPGIPVGRERIMASAGDPRDWFRYGHRLKAAEKAWAEWADARNRRRDFTSGYTWNQILILGDYGSGKTTLGTGAGFLYLAVVVDVFSRRVVGWAMESHIRTELVLQALNMALYLRRPQGVIHHSDQGIQYTAYAFGKRCSEWGVRPSMGSVGDCYDNALCESFFASLECELLDRRSFQTHAEARMAVFQYIEGWYNTHRRHSSIGYYAPIAFERRYTSNIQHVEPLTVYQIGSTPVGGDFASIPSAILGVSVGAGLWLRARITGALYM